ncbi:MAG: Maleylpyruvate isomerase, mycothiol-dependent, partial [uncultured Pseudonocardia sp.]
DQDRRGQPGLGGRRRRPPARADGADGRRRLPGPVAAARLEPGARPHPHRPQRRRHGQPADLGAHRDRDPRLRQRRGARRGHRRRGDAARGGDPGRRRGLLRPPRRHRPRHAGGGLVGRRAHAAGLGGPGVGGAVVAGAGDVDPRRRPGCGRVDRGPARADAARARGRRRPRCRRQGGLPAAGAARHRRPRRVGPRGRQCRGGARDPGRARHLGPGPLPRQGPAHRRRPPPADPAGLVV